MIKNIFRSILLFRPGIFAILLAPMLVGLAFAQRNLFVAMGHPTIHTNYAIVSLSENGVYQGIVKSYPTTMRPFHLATDNEFLYAAVFDVGRGYRMQTLRLDGTLVSEFNLLGGLVLGMENDAADNFYVHDEGIVRKYDSVGHFQFGIPNQATYGGADADAHGRIWVSQYDGLRSYDTQGHALGFTPNPRLWEGHVVIDESRDLLYQAYQPGGVEVYDIASGTPALIRSFSTTEVIHMNYDPSGNSLFVVTGSLSPVFFEYDVLGNLRNTFVIPATNSDAAIQDVVAVNVAEPTHLGLLSAIPLGLLALRRSGVKG